jgi:hypothetical protein
VKRVGCVIRECRASAVHISVSNIDLLNGTVCCMERRVTASPLTQGLSIRNETSADVIRSSIGAQTTDWW